jgi:two-component system, OmpR family, sensor histidine kinase SenX3
LYGFARMRVMGKPFGSRTLLLTCGALMILLAALAVVQYRWSTRVAAADAQREKEHLDSAATLFAGEFDGIAGQAAEFLGNEARAAIESGARTGAVPKLIAELYYLEFPARGAAKAQRLTPEGVFAPAAPPPWISLQHCTAAVLEQPAALVAPIYDIPRPENFRDSGFRVLTRFSRIPDRCFVARLDEGYLRDTLLPRLIRQSFGPTAAQEYDFAVVWTDQPNKTVYGAPRRADLRKPFFSLRPADLAFRRLPSMEPSPPGHMAVIVQHVESTIVTTGGKASSELFGPGRWELEVAHKGVPLAAAFEATRRRDLLLSLGVEALLAAAILFLVIAAGRAQRLADQKVQFVAGVSHELRSPVSAIAMLSRNQADGLVAGAERVKQYGELIHQQSRRLNEMVEQALQYAGIHSAVRRVKAEVDLGRLIEEAVEDRREELAREGFEVEMAIDADLPPVEGDAPLLHTAIDNLLNNAQKHAVGGHWIRVSATYNAAEQEVRISVEDRGGGIEPADQVEIFEPFSRGRAAVEAQIPGSGLGLSLVRSAAEAHRGSVTLVSEPGRGSIFTLHLPV